MKNKKKTNGLHLNEQKMLMEAGRWLYAEVETVILEGFKHTAARPCDAFDALLLIAYLSLTRQFNASKRLDLQEILETDQRVLVMCMFQLGMVMEKKQINVSPAFPFSSEEMIGDFGSRYDEGELAFSQAVSESIERIKPMLIDIANYLTAADPNQRILLPSLAATNRPDK